MSEQGRIGDGQERGEGCAEKKKKKNSFKEEGKGRKGEIYCGVRMEHIKKKVKGLERRK